MKDIKVTVEYIDDDGKEQKFWTTVDEGNLQCFQEATCARFYQMGRIAAVALEPTGDVSLELRLHGVDKHARRRYQKLVAKYGPGEIL